MYVEAVGEREEGQTLKKGFQPRKKRTAWAGFVVLNQGGSTREWDLAERARKVPA